MRYPLVLTMMCALPAALTTAAEPGAGYQPMAFLAGHCWKGAFADGKRFDEHCFAWVYGGRFLRDTHTLTAQGREIGRGETIYFWNSAANQLEYLYIESEGGFSRGTVSTDHATLAFPDTNFVEDGKTQIYRSRWQRGGDTAYEVTTEFKADDKWVPGFKVHMQRLAAP